MPATAHRVKFGDFEFDERTGELWTNGSRIVLPNQPARLLTVLIHRAGILVTRDELRRELWLEDTFVDFEHSLNAGVKRLREAIGDSAAAPRFIETIPQRGYRFIAPVETTPDTPAGNINTVPSSSVVDVDRNGTEPRRQLTGWPVVSATVLVLILVVFALYQLRARRSPSSAGPTRNLVRLTSTSGLSTDPTISPDGSLVAYASDRAGAGDFDIYVQTVAGGDPVRLTNDAADESDPSFAPDGAHIVFSRRGGGLYVVGALGGEPRLIVRTAWARAPRFSPDGRSISYWTGLPAGVPGAVGSIFVVPADGGSPRELVTGLTSARYPIWSPDGEHILFFGDDRKTTDWYVIPRNGGTAGKTGVVERLRVSGLRAAHPVPGSWTAENAVVFATNELGSSNVWQIPISRSTHRVSGFPERLTFGTAIERNPIVANSGRIVFASVVENVNIWRLPVDPNTGVATGALERLTDDVGMDRLRSVSSDGRTLFFISSRAKPDELWMKNIETGREHRLIDGGVQEASASPDASRVAFSRNDRGTPQIEIVGTADGFRSKLCEQCSGPGNWSRDGKRLLYHASVPSRLLLYDFTSNRKTELVSHPAWNLEQPRFSPDGEWVTFYTVNAPTVRQIYSARVEGGPVPHDSWVPVVTDHGCHPSWSPNGALLYYFSFRDGAFCPWVQRVDATSGRPITPPRAVRHFHHPRLRAASGAAAYNDVQAGHLYVTLTEASGNIWMLDSTDR